MKLFLLLAFAGVCLAGMGMAICFERFHVYFKQDIEKKKKKKKKKKKENSKAFFFFFFFLILQEFVNSE